MRSIRSTARRTWTLALALLAAGSVPLAAERTEAAPRAKRCARLCKADVASCRAEVAYALDCASKGKPERKACKRTQREERKACKKRLLSACAVDPSPDACVRDLAAVGEPTAWEQLLARIEGGEGVTQETALAAFDLLVAPLPGVTPAAGPRPGSAAAFGRDVGQLGGCAALRWVGAYQDELTTEQQTIFDAAIAAPITEQARGGSDPVRAEIENLLAQAAVEIGSRIGVPFALTTQVVFQDDPDVTSLAGAVVLNAEGRPRPVGAPALCRVFIPPPFLKLLASDPLSARGVLTHEMFHCYHGQLAGLPRYFARGTPQWVDEGAANFAASDIVGLFRIQVAPWQGWFFEPNRSLALRERVYSGHGIYFLVAQAGGAPWAKLPGVLQQTSHGASFSLLSTGHATEIERSWASSVFRIPARGPEWDLVGFGVPALVFPPAPVTVASGASQALTAIDYGVGAYQVSTTADALIFIRASGHVRIADAAGREFVTMPQGRTLCIEKPCLCPDGSPLPMEFDEVTPPLDVAVTGWTTGGDASMTGASFRDLCDDPDGFCERLRPLEALMPQLEAALDPGNAAALQALWPQVLAVLQTAPPAPAAIAASYARFVEFHTVHTTALYAATGWEPYLSLDPSHPLYEESSAAWGTYFDVAVEYADVALAGNWILEHCEIDFGDLTPEE